MSSTFHFFQKEISVENRFETLHAATIPDFMCELEVKIEIIKISPPKFGIL